MKTKDRILSETPDEVKQSVRDRADLLVNKEETVEEYFLENIKNVLLFKNDAQAIRFMEKYYQAKKEEERSYSKRDMIDFAYNYTEERKNKGARAMTPELLIKQFKNK